MTERLCVICQALAEYDARNGIAPGQRKPCNHQYEPREIVFCTRCNIGQYVTEEVSNNQAALLTCGHVQEREQP